MGSPADRGRRVQIGMKVKGSFQIFRLPRITNNRFHLLVALTTATWLSLEYIALGSYSWMYGYGGTLETIPVHLALAKSNTFSLWAPFVAGGVDRLSFWGNADPLNLEPLLFSILPTWLANGLHVFLQRFVAIYFTARVCQEQLGMNRGWSALAGVFHGCFSYFTVGDMMAISGVPFLIWGLYWIHRSRRPIFWGLLAGAGFSVFTSFTHSVPYLALFAFAWFAIVIQERSPRFYGVMGLFFLGLSVVDGPQLLAALYNAPLSHRAGYPAEGIGLSFSGLFYYPPQFDFFSQDKLLKALVIYLPPLVLGIAAVAAWRHPRGRPECAPFLRIALLYTILSLKFIFILVQKAAAQIFPFINGIFMGRFYTLPAAFMIAVILAMGLLVMLPWLSKTRARRSVSTSIISGLIFFLLIWPKVSLFYPLMIDSWGEKNFQVKALEELRRSDKGLFRVASVLDLQPAYAYGQGLETADGWANLYPKVYRELWLRVLDPLLANLPRNRDVFDPPTGRPQDHYIFLGTGLLVPGLGLMPGEDPVRALAEGFDIERRFNLDLLSLLNVKYLLSEYPLKGQGLRLIHSPSLLPSVLQSRDYATGLVNSPRPGHDTGSVWQSVQQVVVDLQEALERKQQGKDIYIYENTQVLPRYRFVTQVKVADSGRHLLDELSQMTSDDLHQTAWIEACDAGQLGGLDQLSSGTIRVEVYTPDEIRLSIENSGNGFLVIANTWNPFWRTEVDGQPRALVRTNHAQFGLWIRAGERKVHLSYDPPYSFFIFSRLFRGFDWVELRR